MSILIDPRLDARMGCREPHELRQSWTNKAGGAYTEHPHTRPLWAWEHEAELPPVLGEAYRDTLHDIHHAAADAATKDH